MEGIFNKISIKEQASFAKRLAFLIKADVPILQSLGMLKRQSKSGARRKIMDQLIKDVSNGQYMSASLSKYKKSFGVFAINVIKVGEEGGVLDKNLEYLAQELKKRQELKKKVVGSLIYPGFIITATIGVTGLITVYVLPKIIPIFESVHAILPPSTKLLIFMTHLLLNYGLIMIGAAILLMIGSAILYKKVRPFNFAVNRVLLVTPIFGHLVRSYHMANFCRTMGLLLNCELGIVRATNITAQATSNRMYREEIFELAEQITKGKKISTHLETRAHLFPEMVPELISIGETAGNLGETLLYLSDHYDDEVSDVTKNLSSSLEPVLLVFMGIMVGFVAISVITPIYELTKNIHP